MILYYIILYYTGCGQGVYYSWAANEKEASRGREQQVLRTTTIDNTNNDNHNAQ